MHRRAWLLMALLAALWGASYLFIKVALDDLSAPWIVFVRTALGCLVLAPLALSRGSLAPLRGRAGTVVALAALQYVGPFLLITLGERSVPSSLAGILVASVPIFVALLSVVAVREERLPPLGLAGVALGIVGVGLLFGVDLGGGSAVLGGLAILLASLGYAIAGLLARRRMAGVPAEGLTTAVLAVSALALVPALPFSVPGHVPGLDTLVAMLALGCGGTGLAFLIFYVLNADIGPGRASVVAYIAPVFSVVYGVTLLGERFTVATASGLVLILAGSYVAAQGRLPWHPRRPAAPPEPLGATSRT